MDHDKGDNVRDPEEAEITFLKRKENNEDIDNEDINDTLSTDENKDEINLSEILEQQQIIMRSLSIEKDLHEKEKNEMIKEKEEINNEREQTLNTLTQLINNREAFALKEVATPFRAQLKGTKCPTFNGETELQEFLIKFEVWLKLMGYQDKENTDNKTLWSSLLGLALQGAAQTLYCDLTEQEREDYDVIKQKLYIRFGGAETSAIYKTKLHSLTEREPGYSIVKHKEEIKMMIRKGYPNLSREAQEELGLDYLIRSVDKHLKIQCTMQKCQTMDQAVSVIQRYETIAEPITDIDKRKKLVRTVQENKETYNPMENAYSKMLELMEKQTELLTSMNQAAVRKSNRYQTDRRSGVTCYHCLKEGHIVKDCPRKEKKLYHQGN